MNKKNSSTVNDLLSCTINNSAIVNQLKGMGFESKNPEKMTFEEAMVAAQIFNAARGNVRSYELIMDSVKNDGLSPLEQFVKENTAEVSKPPRRGKK